MTEIIKFPSADELARLAAQVGCTPEGQPAKAADYSYAHFLRNFGDYFVRNLQAGKTSFRFSTISKVGWRSGSGTVTFDM